MPEEQAPSSVPPFLVAALVCDIPVVEPTTEKRNLIGIFDRIQVGGLPAERQM